MTPVAPAPTVRVPRLPAGLLARLGRFGRAVGIAVVVLAVAGAAAWFGITSAQTPKPPATPAASTPNTAQADTLRRVAADQVAVPQAAATRIGLQTGVAAAPTRPRTLPPFPGTLAVDTNALARVHPRFAGEVTALGTTAEPIPTAFPGAEPAPGERPLRVGDRVTKGQLLAVVWSKDLGEKKSELVDTLSKLRRDEGVLASLLEAEKSGAVPARSVVDARRDVDAARVAVERAERTLRSWRLTDAEIAAVRTEADQLARPTPGAARPDAGAWARAEVRSPIDGTVIEKNTAVGDIVDTTADLFKVADLSRLTVWAHVYEEDLPRIQELPAPVRWTLSLPSRPGVTFPGTLEGIGAVIDPNQHTALVSGSVENPKGELRAGMFVTVAVALPPAAGEVEVPAEAVVEDGRESVVFVRSSADPGTFTRVPVKVARRLRDVVCLAAGDTAVRPGDTVVTAGSLLLNEAMASLPAPQQ